MSPRKRAKPDLDRRRSTREAKPRLLVVCEGEVTEVDYLAGITGYFVSLPVTVEPLGLGADPYHVVRTAIDQRDEADKEARKTRDANRRFEEVWCLVDVDEHERLPDALRLASREAVNVAVSNPCFELWLLYHFQSYVSSVDRTLLQRKKLPRHLPGYGKRLPADFPYGEYERAERRALEACGELDRPTCKGPNPSTNVWLLVAAIQRIGRRPHGRG